MATPRETMEKTLRTFLAGYLDASQAKDSTKLSAVLTPDCQRHFAPPSFLKNLGAPPDMTLDNKGYEDFFTAELPVVLTKSVDGIENVVIDTEKRTGAATTKYTQEFKDGTLFPFEFAWFVSFDEEGTKISKILEWVDAIETPKYHAKIKELQGKE
ncbi:hypothetical protein QBC47DRAFT_394118 [Echria macrotheca]|uniref:SnoaL-like domain-containing protein n=1 Tax=Echria macrotheca TaxID=438768 RepID=A0AAJ0B2H0_9PEZI|nr:hypothetical protein QBC47DRAFT_394118 [Echria macrotheca]